MASGSHQQPFVLLTEIGANVDTSVMLDSQLRRAWALGFVRIIWPTIQPVTAQGIASWIADGDTA